MEIKRKIAKSRGRVDVIAKVSVGTCSVSAHHPVPRLPNLIIGSYRVDFVSPRHKLNEPYFTLLSYSFVRTEEAMSRCCVYHTHIRVQSRPKTRRRRTSTSRTLLLLTLKFATQRARLTSDTCLPADISSSSQQSESNAYNLHHHTHSTRHLPPRFRRPPPPAAPAPAAAATTAAPPAQPTRRLPQRSRTTWPR